MRITYQERRLRAVKEKYCFTGKVCNCCKAKVKQEKMWSLKIAEQYYKEIRITTLFFCKECAPTREAVLKKVAGEHIYGVD